MDADASGKIDDELDRGERLSHAPYHHSDTPFIYTPHPHLPFPLMLIFHHMHTLYYISLTLLH